MTQSFPAMMRSDTPQYATTAVEGYELEKFATELAPDTHDPPVHCPRGGVAMFAHRIRPVDTSKVKIRPR